VTKVGVQGPPGEPAWRRACRESAASTAARRC
jgi:hypothetical protein